MKNSNSHDERIAKMTFASVYPHYVTKIEKRTVLRKNYIR